MAIGTKEAGSEDRDRQVVEDVRALDHILRRAGLREDRLLVRIDEGATHNEGEWAKRFPEALTFLSACREPPLRMTLRTWQLTGRQAGHRYCANKSTEAPSSPSPKAASE